MYLHFKVSLLASGMWCGNEDVFFGYTVASQCEQQASNFHSIWGKKGCNENICIDYAVFFFCMFFYLPFKKIHFSLPGQNYPQIHNNGLKEDTRYLVELVYCKCSNYFLLARTSMHFAKCCISTLLLTSTVCLQILTFQTLSGKWCECDKTKYG